MLDAADLLAVEKAISPQRLGTYENAMGMKNTRRALELYAWNAQVTGAFMLPQQVCEVVIRNAVSQVIEAVYGPEWPWSQGFIQSLPKDRIGLGEQVEKARSTVGMGDTNKVIPELKFVFWVKLFTKRFDSRLWSPHLRTAFVGLPSGPSVQQHRQMIADELDRVRRFRNRMAHHEPIFERNLAAEYTRMINLVTWRCPQTAAWLQGIDTVCAVLKQRP